MENASKALIMAGSVLIALLIIGALILMFNSLSSYQKTNVEGTRSSQIVEFNNQYDTYDRKNVRGSDLYSLLNKVIDYNRRQSTEGTGSTDRGSELAFEPMTITFTMTNDDLNQLSADGEKRLIRSSSYTIDKTTNKFEDEIKDKINELESEYGSDSLANLTTALTAIFIDDTSSDSAKQDAISKFNSASKKVEVEEWEDIAQDSTIREDVHTYYEYIQFKRLYFDCTNVEYNNQTGRIVKMEFKSNGKFN